MMHAKPEAYRGLAPPLSAASHFNFKHICESRPRSLFFLINHCTIKVWTVARLVDSEPLLATRIKSVPAFASPGGSVECSKETSP
jgi:hypothetical protein